MNDVYEHEQRRNVSRQAHAAMPPAYAASKSHPVISQSSLNDHNQRENDSYKEAYVVQVVQQWNSQNSTTQRAPPPADFASSAVQLAPAQSNAADKTSNKDEVLSQASESDKSSMAMKKRVTPLPASSRRRQADMRADPSSSSLLAPISRSRLDGAGAKKSGKTAPVFIAPKKTFQPLPTYPLPTLDEWTSGKPKQALERQPPPNEEQHQQHNLLASAHSAATTSVRFASHSSFPSRDDDEHSSDDSEDESLLIRRRPGPGMPSILITDPQGLSHTFDFDRDHVERLTHNEPAMEEDSNPPPISPTDSTLTSPLVLDKHRLHSIGEEEEDDDDENHTSANTRPKAHHRTAAAPQPEKEPLERRWSDGDVDQDSAPKSPLTKMSSAASITKPAAHTATKLSKTKYILMKLHLTSSSKDDEPKAALPEPASVAPKQRTVRRSTDKKRYQTQ